MHIFTSSKKKWTSLLVSFLVLLSTQLFAQSQIEPGTFPISSAKARISNSPLSNRSAIINASGTVVANSGVGLQKFYSATGKYTISADGIGSGNSSMNIRVNKPNAGATVKKAVLISAVTFSTIGDNCVSIDGNPVVWDGTAHASFFNNYWADVTSLVASKINSFPAGISTLAITECNSGSIDGEALLVVFDDASATEKTIIIMTGAMNPAGDNFGVTLSQPIDPSQPRALLDMGLGIGFSYQQGGGSQASQVSVNGQRLTSSAGGEDDGQPANGALITVGGIGDKNDNPANPFAGPANPRSDDELYNILPFINNTTTNLTINTINPSQDDNIFLAYFSLSGAAIIGEGILTSQTTTSATTGGNHTVKAVVLNSLGAPVANRNVQFSITSGPNAGGTFTTTTNANGEAFYTYSDLGGAGTDNISACFTDSQNQLSCSNSVAFTWIAPAATLSTAVLEFSNYCPGASLNVPYTVSGTYNASNTFTAQLSNASGSFASPSNIGSVNSTTSGNINATIPSNTPAGTGYRIRVVSSSPALTGSDNGSDFTINPLPTITCPGNQSAFTEAGQCGAHVNFSASGNGVVSYSIAPGSLFPLGTTTVIATVTNSCGSVQCQFNVTVTDNLPPAITAPNATIASCLATIPDLTSSATVSDNCSAASSIVVTQSPAAGTPISPGSTVTVTLTATDASNNQSSVDITVTRPDITPVAVNDAAEVCGGSSVNINVLANDSHPQNLPLTVSDNTTPSVGTLVKNADNTFTYTAPANYSGPVTFNYTIKANDGVIPYSGNNHYYEYVPAYGITWQQAKAAAAARTYNGLKGYLVTVTSAQEQAFVQAKLQGSGWMGASDLAYEGTWRWVTGPEGLEDLGQGRIFSDQRKLPYGNCGANTGQGVGGNYVNWTAGEPNDCGAYLNQFSPTDPNRGGEHYAHFYGGVGSWNDYPNNAGGNIQGYLVEYGGLEPCTPVLTATATVTITVHGLPVVSLSQVPVTCAGGNDGSISVTASNGDTPYQYSIDGGATYQNNNVFAGLTAGNYSIVVKSATGCSSSSNITVTTTPDVTAPVITTCASAQSINLDANCSAVMPDLTRSIVASDNCTPTGSLVITQSPAAGSALSGAGISTVTFTVTDASGNSSTCSTTLDKKDVTPPTFGAVSNVAVSTDPNLCSAVVNYPMPTATDNCTSGSAPVTFSIPGTNSDGTYNVATPAASNVTSITFAGSQGIMHGHGAYVNFKIELYNPSTSTWVNIYDAYGDVNLPGRTFNFPVISQVNQMRFIAGQFVGNAFHFSGLSATFSATAGPTVTQTTGLPSGSAFPVGTTTNTFVATDLSGNSSTTSFDVVVTDNQAPVISASGNQSVNNDPGACGALVTMTATAKDNCGVGNPVGTRSDGLALSAAYPVGTTTVTWNVTDIHGNPAVTVSNTVTVTDNEVPVITASGNQSVNNDPGACGALVTMTATAKDNCGVGNPVGTRSDGLALSSPYPVGTTTVTWNVTDNHGNQADPVSNTVIVTDNEVPVITASGNQSVNNIAGTCGALVTMTATAKDNCGVGSPVGTRNDGLSLTDPYPVGTTTVTWNVTDIHNNNAVPVSNTVTVTDNEKPVITASGNQAVNNDLGTCGALVTMTATAKDNCGVGNPIGTRSDGLSLTAPYPVGTTTVSWNVTDIHGNNAIPVSNTVVVTDSEKPVVKTKPVTITLVNGVASITTADVNNGSTDNCGILNMTVSPSVFHCANIGANTVTLTVNDIHGNTQTATAVVTVTGEIPGATIASIPTSSTYTGGNNNNLYLGYGAQSTTLNVTPNGASGNGSNFTYTYQWSGLAASKLSSTTAKAPVFTPTVAGFYTFTVTVTNNYGCTTTASINICVTDIRVAGSNDKVYVCHLPPGNPGNPQTLSISVNAVPAHLGNHAGDRLGSCSQQACSAITGAGAAQQYVQAEPTVQGVKELTVVASPNPTMNHFRLDIKSNDQTTPVTVKVTDAVGRPLELFSKVQVGSSVSFGDRYTAGSYYALVLQGTQYKVVKLVKML